MTGRRVVLVTGTPRSGTTPVGDTIAAAPGVRTLYEPLNFHVGDRRVQRYFEVTGAGGFTGALADELVADVRRLRLRLRPGIFPDDRGWRRLAKRVSGSRTRMTYRRARLDPRTRTLVWKDPFAAFLAERIADVHAIPVVVTVRPPEAVAASFARLGWSFDVADLVHRLGPAGERYRPLLGVGDLRRPAVNAAVLWHVVNDTLVRASERHPGIHLVDLDALVADRAGTFRALFDTLGLPWDAAVERHLAAGTASGRPARPTGARAHTGRRDISAVNRYWVDVLDDDEVAVVRELNTDLWGRLRAASGRPTAERS